MVLWDVERSLYSVVTADLTVLLCYGMLSGHSILFYSILLYSILLYSTLFYSTLFYSIM